MRRDYPSNGISEGGEASHLARIRQHTPSQPVGRTNCLKEIVMPRKPKGLEAFEKLLRPLAGVSKKQLDREIEKDTKRKEAKKKKRKPKK